MSEKPQVRSFADMVRLGRKYPCPKCRGIRKPCDLCKGYRVDPSKVQLPDWDDPVGDRLTEESE